MAKHKKWTAERVRKIIRLRRQGWTYFQIAKLFGVCDQTILNRVREWEERLREAGIDPASVVLEGESAATPPAKPFSIRRYVRLRKR